jgi:hypothetical protein
LPIYRLLRFGGGLFGGVVLALGLLLAATLVHTELVSGDVSLRASGADISRHGGTRIFVERQSGALAVSCNSLCDDLTIESAGRGNGLRDVRVSSADGTCLECVKHRGPVYRGTREEWTISGLSQLGVTRKTSKERQN